MTNKQTEYEVHPAATLFPMMDADSFERLKKDIKENGQDQRITFFNGMVIDGRNRLKACQELGIEPRTEEIEDDGKFDPYKWVLSMNLHRRHLTESQRAMVAAKLAKLKHGGDRGNQHTGGKGSIEPLATIEQAASMLNVGAATVKRAKQVLEHGSEEIIEAVEKGDISVSLAARVATEEPDKKTQAKVYKRGGKAALKEHITEPSPYVDDKDEKAESAVGAFKKLWAKWDDIQRTAVRVWLDEHYLDG